MYNHPPTHNTGYICYDDGCHLRKFARNPSRKDVTPTAKRLASLEILVDKMHMAGHVNKWCKSSCDARKFTELDNVSLCMLFTVAYAPDCVASNPPLNLTLHLYNYVYVYIFIALRNANFLYSVCAVLPLYC